MASYQLLPTSRSDEEDLLAEGKSTNESDTEGLEDDSQLFQGRMTGWNETLRSFLSARYLNVWFEICKRCGWFFVPSFLRGSEARGIILPTKLHPTAYLDGMRGLAAFCVFIAHWSYLVHRIGLGWGVFGHFHDILRLPIIRLWYQGSPHVCLFFVISGYALSYRSVKLLRSGKTFECYQALGSTLFRRYARLFLPTAASTLMAVCLLQLGVYDRTRKFSKNTEFFRNAAEHHTRPYSTLTAELRNWAYQMWIMCQEFVWYGSPGGLCMFSAPTQAS